MFLTDQHIHCAVSQDSVAPMRDMVLASAKAGIGSMCFTDHCDLVEWRTYELRADCGEVPRRELDAREKMLASFGGKPPIPVYAGLELGEPLFEPELARSIAETPGLDFVLGSLHILQRHGDVWFIDYRSPEHCREVYEDYLDELIAIARLDFFDVMAHIGYPNRCMLRAGFDEEFTLGRYGEKIEALLKSLIDKGQGIEINCSGIRDGCGPFPSPEIIRLYKSLGGEIITVGSDAHSPSDAGKCIAEGTQIIKDCGFDAVAVFKNRIPEFVKI